MMHKIILVGLGGFIGAVLRYLISGAVQSLTQSISFPYGTLAVNVIGCFVIGMFSYLMDSQFNLSLEVRMLVVVGVLGSLTTYSTFSNETVNLFLDQRYFLAFMNVTTQLILGVSAVILGRLAITLMWR